jgi:uncharacterized OsmC-like protein
MPALMPLLRMKMTSFCLPLLALLGCTLLMLVHPIEANQSDECERLKQTLEYTQEDAPRDFTKVVRTKHTLELISSIVV